MTKIPLLVLNPQESRGREGPIMPTAYATTIGRDSLTRPFWQLAKASTNPIANPSFETLPLGVDVNGTATLSQAEGFTSRSAYSLKVVGTGGMSLRKNVFPAASGRTVTFSANIKSESPVYIWMFGVMSDGATGTGDTYKYEYFDEPANGGRYSATYTPTASTTAYVCARIISRNAVQQTFYVDDMLLEDSEYATPYFDGSLGAGFSWAGNPHGSASTRDKSLLSVPCSEDPMTIAVKTDEGVSYFNAHDGQVMFGTYGEGYYHYDSSTLQLTSSGHTSILGIAAFKEELTLADKTRLENTDTWTWENFLPRIGGVLRTDHSQTVADSNHINAYPTVLLPLEDTVNGQDRNGPVTTTATGAIRWVDGPRAERTYVRPLLVASPDNTEDAQGPLTPLIAGSVNLTMGPVSAGRVEGTINLEPNPLFADTYGWTNYGPAIAHDSNVNDGIGASLRVDRGAASGFYGVYKDTNEKIRIEENQPYTISCSIRQSVAGATTKNTVIQATYYDVDGVSLGSQSQTIAVEVGQVWNRYSITTTSPAGAVFLSMIVYTTSGQVGDQMWITKVQIENKPYATEFVYGDMPNASWRGVPNRSASIRQGAQSWQIKKARTPKPTLKITPSESRDQVGGLLGDYEATENVVKDPRFINGMSSFVKSGQATSAVVDTDVKHEGRNSIRIVTAVSNVYGGIESPWNNGTIYPAQTGETWTYSAFVKGTGGTVKLALDPRYTVNNYGSTGIQYGQPVKLTDEWQRVFVTVPIPKNADFIMLRSLPSVVGVESGEITFWLASPQLEKKEHTTPYVDGSMTGGTWTGTANASSSTRAQGADLSGAIRPAEGTKTLLNVGTQNLIVNPSAETNDVNTGGWGSATRTRTNEEAYSGSYSIKVVTVGTNGQGVAFVVPSGLNSTNETFTLSAWAKCPVGYNLGIYAWVTFTDGTSANWLPLTESVASTGSWQRLVRTGKMHETKTVDRFSLAVYIIGAHTPVTFYVDAAQAEKRATVTEYCDGSLGTLHSWTGTAHESSSIRQAEYAYTPSAENGWFIEEGTTNYATNPVSHTSTGGYYLGGGATMERVLDRPELHPTATRIYFDPNAYGTVQHNVSVPVGASARTFTASYYAIGNGKARISMSFHGGTNGTVFAPSVEYTLTSTPQRLVVTGQEPNSGYNLVVVYLQSLGTPNGPGWATEATWSKIQVEEKPYATSYCDGSLGAGYAWSGTAYASTSTRTSALLRIPTSRMPAVYGPKGSMVIRYRRKSTNGTGNKWLFTMGNYAADNNFLGVRLNSSGGPVVSSYSGTTNHELETLSGHNTGQWETVYVEWDEQEIGIAGHDGTFRRGPRAPYKSASVDTTNGFGYSFAQASNPDIASVVSFPRPLTDAERAAIYEQDAWTWDDLNEEDGQVLVGQYASRNLMQNPYFSGDFGSIYNETGVTATFTADTTDFAYGTQSLRFDVSNVTSTANTMKSFPASNVSSTNVRTVTVSCRVKTTHQHLLPAFYISVGNQTFYSANDWETNRVPIVGDWYTLRKTFLLAAAPTNTTVSFQVRAYCRTGAVGSVWFDAAQIEEGIYATPFFSGDDEGTSWEGAPLASASIRGARGDVSDKRSALVRYKENDALTTALVTETTQLGDAGYVRFEGGSLLLEPVDGKTFEVESVAVYDVDVTDSQADLSGVADTWSINNASRFVDVPVQVPFLEEGTENVIKDPLFQNASWFYNEGTAYTPITQDVQTTYEGAPTGRFTIMGTSGTAISQANVTAAEGEAWTFTLYMKADRAGIKFRANALFRNSSNVVLSGVVSSFVTLDTAGFTKITATATAPAGTTSIQPYFEGTYTTTEVGATVWVGKPQLEKKPYATSFCPELDAYGNPKSGFAWTGQPHASSSTRAVARVQVRHENHLKLGAAHPMALIFRFALVGPTPTAQQSIWTTNNSSWWPQAPAIKRYTDNRIGLWPSGYGLGSTATASAVPVNEWHTYFLEWDGTTFRSYMDGVLVGTTTSHTPIVADTYGTLHGEGNILARGILYFERPLTESERTTLFESEVWEWENMYPRMSGMLRQTVSAPISALRIASDMATT